MRSDRIQHAAVSASTTQMRARAARRSQRLTDPDDVELGKGALHVWRAGLDEVGEALGGLLDKQELARATRIVREPARRRWIAARGVLRALLGDYLGEDPRALRFTLQERGKPELESLTSVGLHFNMSHSGPLALYAVSAAGAVGVDVEMVERSSPRPRARHTEFLRAWVRYEAEGKHLGVGVGVGVGNTKVQLASTTQNAHVSSPAPWIAELDLNPEALGAVALAKAPLELSLRRWPI